MRQLQSEWKDIPVVEEKNNAGCCNNMHSFKSICFQHWQRLSPGSCFLFELWQVARVINTAHSKNIPSLGAPLRWRVARDAADSQAPRAFFRLISTEPSNTFSHDSRCFYSWSFQAYQWDAQVSSAHNPSMKLLIFWICCWLLSKLNSTSQNKNLKSTWSATRYLFR